MYFPSKSVYKYFYLIKIKNNNYTKTTITSKLPDDYVERFQQYDKLFRISYYLDL